MELEIIKFFQSTQSVFFDVFFHTFSILASWVGFCIVFIFFFIKNKRFSIYFGVCYGIIISLNSILKLIIARPRPYMIDNSIINVTNSVGNSMPSGHIVSGITILAFIWLFLFINKNKNMTLYYIVSPVFLVLVGISRMYFGQHYISDLIVGTFVGGILCLGAIIVYIKHIKKFTRNVKDDIIIKE